MNTIALPPAPTLVAHELPAIAPPMPVATPGTLRRLFRAHRGPILFTYALFNVENVLQLLQPLAIGLAIDDLLRGSARGLLVFVAQHLTHLFVGTARQVYDTRTFTRVYGELATNLVLQQRGGGVEVSRVVARSALSREFVDFFDTHLPLVIRSLYSVVGALLMVLWYDWLLAPLCLALLLPAALLNRVYGRKTLLFNGKLHDEFEREVEVIHRADRAEVRGHYASLARWRVKLSDWEALNFSLMEVFVLGLLAAVLWRFSSGAVREPGEIFAVLRYVLMFVMGLDGLPVLVRQFSRLRDIGKRM